MILNTASPLHFVPSQDAPIPYMRRTREYYAALGYHPPYEWAHYAEVPWTRLRKPLQECRLTIVTTAAPFQPDNGDQGPGAPYNAAAKFYKVYAKSTAQDPNCASPTSRSTASTQRLPTPAPTFPSSNFAA